MNVTKIFQIIISNNLFFDFDLLEVVFGQLRLKNVSHLGEFSFTLTLEGLYEIGHFQVLLLCDIKFLSQIGPGLLILISLFLEDADFGDEIVESTPAHFVLVFKVIAHS